MRFLLLFLRVLRGEYYTILLKRSLGILKISIFPPLLAHWESILYLSYVLFISPFFSNDSWFNNEFRIVPPFVMWKCWHLCLCCLFNGFTEFLRAADLSYCFEFIFDSVCFGHLLWVVYFSFVAESLLKTLNICGFPWDLIW